MKQVKAGNSKTLQQPCKGSSIYRVTAPRSQYNLSQQTNVFRPVSPYGHHIYMEIDPVYAHAAESATSEVISDIQLSDISDDDLKRFSDNSRASSNRYGEERPLIRATQMRQSMPGTDAGRHCFTAHRPNQQQQDDLKALDEAILRLCCQSSERLFGKILSESQIRERYQGALKISDRYPPAVRLKMCNVRYWSPAGLACEPPQNWTEASVKPAIRVKSLWFMTGSFGVLLELTDAQVTQEEKFCPF